MGPIKRRRQGALRRLSAVHSCIENKAIDGSQRLLCAALLCVSPVGKVTSGIESLLFVGAG